MGVSAHVCKKWFFDSQEGRAEAIKPPVPVQKKVEVNDSQEMAKEEIIRDLIARQYIKEILINKRAIRELNYDKEKITPLSEAIPQEAISMIKEYDPEKSNILDKIFVITDDRLDDIRRGEYLRKMQIDKNGQISFSSDDEGHLIALPPIKQGDSPFRLAQTLVHEIFGHAMDNSDGNFSEFFEEPEDGVIEDPMKLCEFFSMRLQSEFKSYFIENHFREWAIKNKIPSFTSYQEEMEQRRKSDPELDLPDFDLFEIYKRARETGDWTKFKETIIFINITGKKRIFTLYLFCQIIQKDNLDALHEYRDGPKGDKELEKFLKEFFGDFLTPEAPE
ncbi:hypothetical protein KKA33_00540 [Patescibacteria group bacterium]|nr:hypothetical protein [Patescibacteria group bacterium]